MKPVPATKYAEGTDVWLEKTCPLHGVQKVHISKDAVRFFDQTFAVDCAPVFERQRPVDKGCPEDCGLCPEHRQHLCTGMIEITSCCNLTCPICYLGEIENRADISVAEFSDRLEALLRAEGGKLNVLQISGGEPTLHRNFAEILDLATSKEIGRILVNSNGLRLLDDDDPIRALEKHRDRAEVFLQFDGFYDAVYRRLRGVDFIERKLKIIKRLDERRIKISLAVAVFQGNIKELPAILDLACRVGSITGVTFQRLVKVGRAKNFASETIFLEDILNGINHSNAMKYKDLIPLPCAHANCTSLGILLRTVDGKVYTLSDCVDYEKRKDATSNQQTILDCVRKNACCNLAVKTVGNTPLLDKLREFPEASGSSTRGMKIVRIFIKNFMDAETFEADRAKQCCLGVSTGGNRIVPFCIHNILRNP